MPPRLTLRIALDHIWECEQAIIGAQMALINKQPEVAEQYRDEAVTELERAAHELGYALVPAISSSTAACLKKTIKEVFGMEDDLRLEGRG